MRNLWIVALILLLNHANAQKWELVWNDEFNYTGLPDSSKWGYEVGFVRNNEPQYYTEKRIKNARVEDGSLILEAHKEIYKGALYSSASIHNKTKGDFIYGKIEVCAKLPEGKGSWPAIWLLGSSYPETDWPICGEIDIMEHVGYDMGKIHFNVHTNKYNWSKKTNRNDSIMVPTASTDYHVYAMEWYPEKLVFWVDGKQTYQFVNDGTGEGGWPFDKPCYLILNLAIGGAWGGKYGIDDAIFPVKYAIDYVRIYKQVD
jgi:beta-glucanase (GH16 family)